MSLIRLAVAVVVFIVGITAPATAQINSPPPALMGQPSYHLYTVTGARDSLGIGTFFSCTNTSSPPIRVGIELFAGWLGLLANDASATSIEVAPGGTYFFGTGPAIGIPGASDLGLT